MNSLDNGSSNSPYGLKTYEAVEDHIFGGMMLEENEDGELYQKYDVDQAFKELVEYIEILRSESFEARGHAAVVSCILRDFDEATIWRKLQWALKPKSKK